MFWYLLKAEVYKDNWVAQNLRQLERKIRACVKNYDPDPMVMLLKGSGQRTETLEQLKPNQFFQIIKKRFLYLNIFLIFNKSIIKLKL